ncbi:trypsin-like peptidase domain-containing protein [Rhodococcus erythropolis]|uniref:trypsin-like peptidase domain-containing protein n=1 Tax=Rhodococcus erythropolis TaxID=1833 RepID=UPI001BE67F78|nr:trypsin-like peptidase domain-containing protein [Rhodococcus erythropolis]MBT2268431.1 trypsin-like peptidase domain-containing protein [Rhodococcus erythropolis]
MFPGTVSLAFSEYRRAGAIGVALAAVVGATALTALPAQADVRPQPDPIGSVLDGRLTGPNDNGAYFVDAPYTDAAASRAVGQLAWDYLCTGSVINSNKRTLVITAAHCIGTNKGGGYEISPEFRTAVTQGRVEFTPAFDGRKTPEDRPFGTWNIADAWVLPASNADVAILEVEPNGRGQLIQDAVGGGFDIHAPITAGERVRATLVGYPAPEPFLSVAQSGCVGDYTLYPGEGNSSIRRVAEQRECWVGGGSSGGPYLSAPSTAGGPPQVLTVLNSNGGADVPPVAGELLALADTPALEAPAIPGLGS